MVCRPDIIDFVQCSYLGADDRQLSTCWRDQAIERHGSLRWFCARTRLKCDVPTSLEAFAPGKVLCACAPLVVCFAKLPGRRHSLAARISSLRFHRSVAGQRIRSHAAQGLTIGLAFEGRRCRPRLRRSITGKGPRSSMPTARLYRLRGCSGSTTLSMPPRCDRR